MAGWEREGAARPGRCPFVKTLKATEHQGLAHPSEQPQVPHALALAVPCARDSLALYCVVKWPRLGSLFPLWRRVVCCPLWAGLQG